MHIENLGVLLEPGDKEFENEAVLNPACLLENGTTHMYYRAVRKGNFSTIGYCQLRNGAVTMRMGRPLLVPEYHFESHGLEDPRIVKIDGVYYLFYTAYDGKSVHAAYATGTDLVTFEKQGPLSPTLPYEEALQLLPASAIWDKYRNYGRHYEEVIGRDVLLWEKDTFIFPKKIGGKFLLLIRVMPGIQMVAVESLDQLRIEWWKEFLVKIDTHVLMQPSLWFETRKIGPGCPPIETPDGWLMLYHGVEENAAGNIYRAAAALLDLDNPFRVIARLPEPLFSPNEPWEKIGEVPNVVFPTGATVEGDRLTVYYGAADNRIAAKALSMKELLSELKSHRLESV